MALTKVTGHVIKSDTNITSHNINSSGIVTAITFDGNFTGVAVTFTGDSTIGSLGITTNLNVGGISTFTGNIDANGDIDVDGHTNLDNVNISGVTTTTDSIHIKADNKFLLIGQSNDLSLAHTAGHSYIADTGTGGLYLTGSNVRIQNATQNEDIAVFNQNDSVDLYFNNTKRFETTNTGAVVSGILTVTGNMNVEGVLTYQDVTNIDSVGIVTARAGIVAQDDVTFQTANGSNIFIDKSDNSIRLGDSVTQYLGSDNDLWFLHNGSTGYIHNVTGSLYIRNESAGDIYIQGKSGENSIICNDDGNVQLYNDNVIKFNTGSTGVTVHGTTDPNLTIRQGASSSSGSGFLAYENVDGNGTPRSIVKIQGKTAGNGGYGDLIFQTAFNNSLITRWTIDNGGHFIPGAVGSYNIGSTGAEIGNVYLADSKVLYLGSDQDLSISHNGTHGYIHAATGGLYMKVANGEFLNRSGSQVIAKFLEGTGGVELYHNNIKKLNTVEKGIEVTGEVAATQDYPNQRPTLDLNFAAVKKLDPRITYTRTGPASFTNEFGEVVLVGDNTPRFDHDPTTRESKGLLVEESRTNLLSYSIPDSNWNLTNSTITENAAIAPDGTNTATLHFDNTTNDQHLLYTTATVSNATNYVVTSYLKQPSSNSRRYYSVTIHGLGYVVFDVQNGTVHSSSGTGIQGATSTAVGNGWYRVQAHYVTTSTTGNIYWLPLADDGGSVVYSGTSTAQGMLVWGCQLEAATFETSYIPTNGSTATRGVDITLIDGEEFSEFYNDDEWTMITDTNVDNTQSLVASPSVANSINFEGDDNTKKFQTRYVTSSTVNQGYVDIVGNMSGTPYYDLTGGGVGNYNMKTAHAAKVNDVAASHNGGTVQTDTSVTMLTGGSIMNIGENPKQCHIKRILYYPKRLPNSQLVTLTS